MIRVALWLACCASLVTAQDQVVVGSKNFTESAILAEVVAQMLEAHTELRVERRTNLGGTMICHAAVRAGEIDIYVEYTGTGWAAVLEESGKIDDPLRAFVHVQRRYRDEFDVHWLEPLGLNNSYAIAMTEAKAEALGVRTVSDLRAHQAELRAGFSIEFGNRDDGYPGLAQAYDLALGSVRTLEHGLAYQAIQNGDIDLTDAYTTDGKLQRYALRVLEDDRRFFPPYHAAPLVHGATLRAHPEIGDALGRLAFRIPDAEARAMNLAVEAEGRSAAEVVRAFLEREGLTDESVASDRLDRESSGRFPTIFRLALEHLALTLVAVLLASLAAIPLGIACTTRPALRRITLGAAGVMQTVPSLALLAFMIPFLGLNVSAAIAALFLYALLPIVRNTFTGITEVDRDLVDAARGMGMTPRQILRKVELPLAARTIMAGVRTATVISIGVATLAAFIGAGGLGEPILEGLYLNDTGLILSGAIPAAVLAVLADAALARVEKRLAPRVASE